MNKNLDTPVLRLDGQEYDDKPTFGSVLFMSIQAALPDDQRIPTSEKMKLYRLAQKVVKGGIVDFSSEELALMKKRVEEALPTILMGTVVDMLDRDQVISSPGGNGKLENQRSAEKLITPADLTRVFT